MTSFNFGAPSAANTTLFGQSTPVNQTRTGSGLFLGNTTVTGPSALTSTPFGSTTLFGAATPAAITSTGTGSIHKFDALPGVDKINKNGTQTQIRTKIFNLCAMAVYEKKSMEEIRLEDYVDNRKFASATTSLFPSATSTPSMFGGGTTAISTVAATPSLFGAATTPAPSTLGAGLFGNKPTVTATPTLPFAFGSTATTTAASVSPFSFGSTTTTTANPTSAFGTAVPASAPAAATPAFSFGSSQPAAAATTTAAPAFTFGGGSTLFPAASTAATAGTTSFGFATPKPATAPAFSFVTTTTTASATPAFGLFSTTTTAPAATAAPTLFSAAGQPAALPVFATQSSVDTKTHLQLFQTMLNIQPFNSELAFLAKNIKPNIGLDRTRLRTAPDASNAHPLNNVFSPLLTKPSVLAADTSTPPSALLNPLPAHPHTVPSVLLPSSSGSASFALFGKRKLADSFLDDDDDNSLMTDDGPSAASSSAASMHRLPKSNAIKRPRVLDMNKIRSVVLGRVDASHDTAAKEETLSDTYVVKPTSDNLSSWKKFATYDAYLASKKQHVENVTQPDDDQQIRSHLSRFEQERTVQLPRLTQDDYYIKPTLDELRRYVNEQGQCLVNEFTVGRQHYGSVTFHGSRINLTGLDLNQLIVIDRRQVTVYPDDNNKPAEGEELNCRATISLLGVYPIDRSKSNAGEELTDPDRLIEMNYENFLHERTKKFAGKFIDYDVYTGTWTFQLFSLTYGQDFVYCLKNKT